MPPPFYSSHIPDLPPHNKWVETAQQLRALHHDLAKFSTRWWRTRVYFFAFIEIFLAIAVVAIGSITAAVAGSTVAARWLAVTNAIVGAVLAGLRSSGISGAMLRINFLAKEIRADLSDVQAKCNFDQSAPPDLLIQQIQNQLEGLRKRRADLRQELTKAASTAFSGISGVVSKKEEDKWAPQLLAGVQQRSQTVQPSGAAPAAATQSAVPASLSAPAGIPIPPPTAPPPPTIPAAHSWQV
ncbi:hypothetical protein EHS25_006403 [Saitozyma podzolica]|uniref:SMODS and SLOG-associating 2TM effector domain-containing protein n=1 Tax=Saitozyma podzolica TaxID=1890683 RepID=A0A427YRR8_9TREE|nr:hypothetical protein EHS25_006403 [Saitozyma podzolica]